MFAFKVLYISVFILCHVLSDVYGQQENKFFRSDYTYMESTKAFYKIHSVHKNWKDAKKSCASEGASLFYPGDSHEAEVIVKWMNETTPFHWVFIGVSDVLSKGVYDTIDGIPVKDVYHKWALGEPNGEDAENCGLLRRTTFIQDDNCSNRWPFICKKPLDGLQWNTQCNMPNMDYEYSEALGRCYKFHLKPLNWTDAYAICSAEQSYLAIINSPKEADYLKNLTQQAPKENVAGDYLRGAVHLGFHNRDGEGWQTTKGVSLESSGYAEWSYTQPDGNGEEKCGSMFYTGGLNDIGCGVRMFFICEHNIDSAEILGSEY